MAKALTYSTYLQLDQLLSLQTPRSAGPAGPEHDELLFIVIHQVYELWFKQILHEVDYLQLCFRENDTPHAVHTMRRILTILKTIVAQVDVLETMTPLEFNAFRGFLQTASGFQSPQFREIEFAFGYKRPNMLNYYPDEMRARERLEARYTEPSVWDAFLLYLSHNGYPIGATQLHRDVRTALSPDGDVQAILVDIYRHNPAVRNVCERLVDIDEGFQEWRYRHVKMVERTVGSKPGTGGSTGAHYLATTIKPFFPDLWAIRAQL